jgi:gamma-glutamyltranspeptidase
MCLEIKLRQNTFYLTDLSLFFFRELFVNPKTGQFFHHGDRIRPKKFCETLKIIAKNGGNCLYNGSLAKMFVSDIQKMGGIITEEDMANYRYKITPWYSLLWKVAIDSSDPNNSTFHTFI